ncbi:MAG TPA: zinc metallopeptidase [Phycisphaerae bacterium]|jgi:hypothetical protein
MIWWDPYYFLIVGPAMLLSIWATVKVKGAFARASQIAPHSGMSGAEAAARVLATHGLRNVAIEPAEGFLSDHYDPRTKVLRLSPDVYQGRSLAAVGVAAHEAGHAIQDATAYGPLAIRNGLVPMAAVGSNLAFILFFIGVALSYAGGLSWGRNLVLAGIVLFSLTVVFQLVNLPVEFDASRRARAVLVSNGIIDPQEEREVARVLNAAALTYVAATLTAILTLLYLLMRSGLLGGRRN